MKHFFTFVLLVIFASACKPKVLSGPALQHKLIETMNDYLRKTPRPGITFTVKDVIYYPQQDKKNYICQFHVDMRNGNKDTIGIMAATISNDFKEVVRQQ